MVRSGAAAVDVQPIDRLEEKVRQMVSVIDALRLTAAGSPLFANVNFKVMR